MTMPDDAVAEGRLRARRMTRPFEIVLVEPEIPPNTGNIARLCAATGCALHLVGPLGFRIDEHAVRRAGLDYWHLVSVHQHVNLMSAEQAITANDPSRVHRRWLFFSGKAKQSLFETELGLGDVLVFGRESVGLPESLLRERPDDVVGIPTLGEVRSLNLANAVAIALYEGLRRTGALRVDPTRR